MKLNLIKNNGNLAFNPSELNKKFGFALFTPTREQIKQLVSLKFEVITLYDVRHKAWLEIYQDLTAKLIVSNLCYGVTQLDMAFIESVRQESMLSESEVGYLNGRKMAYLAILDKCISELQIFDDLAVAHARWVLERQECLVKLRTLCTQMESDNAWPDDSYLPDVIDNLIDTTMESKPQ